SSDGDGRPRSTPPMLVLGREEAPPRHTPAEGSGVFVAAVERILAAPDLGARNRIGDRAAESADRPRRAADEPLERMASLGLVAASVAHEISSPLASLWMDLSFLKQHLAGDETTHEAVAGAFEALERIRTIIDDIRE